MSSAAFVLDNLAIVIDGKLYLYSLTEGTWTPAQGLEHITMSNHLKYQVLVENNVQWFLNVILSFTLCSLKTLSCIDHHRSLVSGVKSMVSTVSALQCCFSKDKACMVNSTAKYLLSSNMCVTVVCSTVVLDCCEWLCDVLCLVLFVNRMWALVFCCTIWGVLLRTNRSTCPRMEAIPFLTSLWPPRQRWAWILCQSVSSQSYFTCIWS